MNEESEFLVSYGLQGEFGRFRAVRSLQCGRGDRVVVRGPRGLAVGEILCPATPGHARFLPNSSVGTLLRLALPHDEALAAERAQVAQDILTFARQTLAELNLPVELVEAELSLDGENAVLYYLRWEDCDFRSLVSQVSRRFDVQVHLSDLAIAEPQEHEHGCGSCGSGGGCGSCGEGGCKSCGSATAEQVQAYFAQLREQMLHNPRLPLI
jgi:cell fate regulator YaaT (PSP1 superfamily)